METELILDYWEKESTKTIYQQKREWTILSMVLMVITAGVFCWLCHKVLNAPDSEIYSYELRTMMGRLLLYYVVLAEVCLGATLVLWVRFCMLDPDDYL